MSVTRPQLFRSLAPSQAKSEGVEGRRSMSGAYSLAPCDYSLRKLVQDASASTLGVENEVNAPQGTKYRIKLSWKLVSGPVSGWLDFRAIDWNNHYVLFFYPTQVGLVAVKGGVWTDVARAFRPIDSTHPATFTLVMDGYTLSVKDDAVPGSPTILSWTDPWQLSILGAWVSHNTGPGTKAVWSYSIGKALSPA